MSRLTVNMRDRARRLRADMTPQEKQLWRRLRELNRMMGMHFRRQAPIGGYIADYAEFGRRLVIVVDRAGHGGPEDKARDCWLQDQGFRVLHFVSGEVNEDEESVMQVILEALADDIPPPPSRPLVGRGWGWGGCRADLSSETKQ